MDNEYTLRIDGVEVTDYENVIVNGVSYKCKKSANVPTDLTGYTVIVPSGWSASNVGKGYFSISGNVEYNNSLYSFSQCGIGYNVGSDALQNNVVSFGTSSGAKIINDTNVSFRLFNLSGSDVTNSDLIQWFVDNGATFTKPELITFTIDNVSYQAEPNMLWEDWVNSIYNTDEYIKHPNLPDTVRKWSGDYNVCYIDESGVSLTAPIIANYSYITKYVNSGGGSN